MQKKHLKFFVLALFTFAFISFAPASALAATAWLVPGNNDHACTAGDPNCDTIQEAVNAAASSGDTITVAAGTYAENVNIGKSLTLNGPNVGISGNGSRVTEAVVSSMNITASNVIVDGFSFTNGGVQMNINGATTLSV